MVLALSMLFSCEERQRTGEDTFTNPVITSHNNTSIVRYDSLYYNIFNEYGQLKVASSKDASRIMEGRVESVFNMSEIGLVDLWHPQLTKIGDTWYIYVTADDGNTDNHRIHVLKNDSEDLYSGNFEYLTRIKTDPDDNWAIHPYVFEYKGRLYMIWSGWESKRVFTETQCIYIAEMSSPTELGSPRKVISRPDFEWEKQYVQKGGYVFTRYPVFVNEAPFFFCDENTDKAYIYYSASANWTSYICVGELSAEKDSDFLDPESWKKTSEPVFRQNREDGVYGPAWPYIFRSERRDRYYLVYSVINKEVPRMPGKAVFMQDFDLVGGRPDFGKPVSRETRIPKP